MYDDPYAGNDDSNLVANSPMIDDIQHTPSPEHQMHRNEGPGQILDDVIPEEDENQIFSGMSSRRGGDTDRNLLHHSQERQELIQYSEDKSNSDRLERVTPDSLPVVGRPDSSEDHENRFKQYRNDEKPVEMEVSRPSSEIPGRASGELYDDQEDTEEEQSADGQLPLLFVDVNLGQNQMQRIILHEGEDPIEVAKQFARDNNLDVNMENKLIELLNQQAKGVLSKIDEDDEDED